MWHDSVLFFFWFRSLTCTVRLLFDRRPRSRGWKILGVDGKGIGVERSWKLDNSHGHYMCIATYWSNRHCVKSVQIRTKKNSVFGHFSRSETNTTNFFEKWESDFNLFLANVPLLYTLKIPDNQRPSGVFGDINWEQGLEMA